jgi:hypothetical protein
MATIDATGSPAGAALSANAGRAYWIANVVDVADTSAGWASADVVQCLQTYVEVLTALNKVIAADSTMGDATTVNGFDTDLNLDATAGTVFHSTPSNTNPALGGKLYTANDTLDLVVGTVTSGPATVGKFKVMALCYNMEVGPNA